MYAVVGNCSRCGAPIYAPSPWNGVTPPPSQHSCTCFPQNYGTSTNTITVSNETSWDPNKSFNK